MRSRRRPTAVLLGLVAVLVCAAPAFALSGNGAPADIVEAIPVLTIVAFVVVLTTLLAISEARR